VPTHSSLVTTSDSLIAGFVVPSALFVVFQVSVELSWVEVFRVLSGVPSLKTTSISNKVRDKNGDLLAASHSILDMGKK
jgi:hypothetical protein